MVQRFVLLRQFAIENPLKCDNHPLNVTLLKKPDKSISSSIDRCKEAAGDKYSLRFLQQFKEKNLTSTENGDKWWDAFSATLIGELKSELIKTIFPGNDSFKRFKVHIRLTLKGQVSRFAVL